MKKFFIMLLFAIPLFAQSSDPSLIMKKVIDRFQEVHDYQVDVSIKLDFDFLKAPESKAKLYFKEPDKTKFESDGFAMLPKQVFNFSPAKLLLFDYSAVYLKKEKIDDREVELIKVIPEVDTLNVSYFIFWVDAKSNLVRYIETIARPSNRVNMHLKYKDGFEYPLPSEVEISFYIETEGIPPEHHDEIVKQKKAAMGRRDLKGSVTVTYGNYKVNKGIDDSIFDDKKK